MQLKKTLSLKKNRPQITWNLVEILKFSSLNLH
jgi:hypothetical protein